MCYTCYMVFFLLLSIAIRARHIFCPKKAVVMRCVTQLHDSRNHAFKKKNQCKSPAKSQSMCKTGQLRKLELYEPTHLGYKQDEDAGRMFCVWKCGGCNMLPVLLCHSPELFTFWANCKGRLSLLV